jgi:hypothetical protein
VWKTEPAKGNIPTFVRSVVPMRFSLMAYSLVKMKGETMSNQQPVTSLCIHWSKGIDLSARRYLPPNHAHPVCSRQHIPRESTVKA